MKRLKMLGVGIQCHNSAIVVRKRRLKDVICLHSPSKHLEEHFWESVEILRERKGLPSICIPCGGNNITVIHSHDRVHPDDETIKVVVKVMMRKGFVGFMLPEGIFVFKRNKPIFDNFCRSIGLKAGI
ncbi:MAG: hypothetical protein HY228_02175 [Candidatus Yonathbacteria bacterium]|nr:hypothetical protein [Candidatus Yonathbacteria bacterium]